MNTSAISLTLPKQTIRGPGGIKLTLDASEIYPDNPGEGTPMLIEYKDETMTLNCAEDNADELGCNDVQIKWIHGICNAANDWLDTQYDLIRGKV